MPDIMVEVVGPGIRSSAGTPSCEERCWNRSVLSSGISRITNMKQIIQETTLYLNIKSLKDPFLVLVNLFECSVNIQGTGYIST